MEEIAFIEDFINKNKEIEENIEKYLDNETDDRQDFIYFQQYVKDLQINNDKYELKRFLQLISQISNYHHGFDVFNKIECILTLLHENIKEHFTNIEIFRIFHKNKKLLLLLFKAKVLTPDNEIFKIIRKKVPYKLANYLKYFYPQFKSFIDELNSHYLQTDNPDSIDFGKIMKLINCKEANEDPDLFDEKQKNGENDDYICGLIRNDSIVDFIAYVNQSNISLSSEIPESIYETNRFLIKNKNQTLIEYAAFFGSIQIFKYMVINKVNLTPTLWIYAIHGKNADLIHLLEENHVELDETMYEKIINESIKCHYNDITNYIIMKYNDKKTTDSMLSKSIKSYNYVFMSDKIKDIFQEDFLFNWCKYDYIEVVDVLLKRPNIDINMKRKLNTVKPIINDDPIYNLFFGRNLLDAYNGNNVDIVKDVSLLYISVENENEEIVELLLKQTGIDVNMISESNQRGNDEYEMNKKSALHVAIENGNINIVKLLLSQENININAKAILDDKFSLTKKTALIFAIDTKNSEMIQLLLQQPGIDLEKNYYDQNHNDPDFDADFFDFDDTIHMTESSALYYAVKNHKHQIVKLLLSHDFISPNSKQITIIDGKGLHKEMSPLNAAIENNDVEMVKILLPRNDIDINYKAKSITYNNDDECHKEETILYYAVNSENEKIIDLLLSNKEIDVNEYSTVTKYHINNDKSGKYEISKEYLTPLHLAVMKKNLSIIEILLKHKEININIENSEHKKPFELSKNKKIKKLFDHYSS